MAQVILIIVAIAVLGLLFGILWKYNPYLAFLVAIVALIIFALVA